MKKSDLMTMAYTAETSTMHYGHLAKKIIETVGGLIEVLANTDPMACKELLASINKQMTPEMLDNSIAEHLSHKLSEVAKGMKEMGEGTALHFEEETFKAFKATEEELSN